MPVKRTGRKRSRKNFVALPVSAQLTLGTLAANTVLTANLIATLTEDLFVISADLTWALLAHTAGEGPIEVGVAHGDLSVAEILEAVAAAPTGPGDIIQNERSHRPVRQSGAFPGLNTDEVIAQGSKVRTRCKFLVSDGVAFNAYALNRSGGTLTTGALVRVSGNLYGRWII